MLRRRWFEAVFAFMVVVGLVTAYTVRQPKVYESSVLVVLEQNSLRPLGSQVESLERSTPYYFGQREYRTTQIKIIRSRPVLQRVVDQLHLESDYDFLGITGETSQELEEAKSGTSAVDVLYGRLTATPIRDSMIAEITVEDRVAKRAATLANAVVQAYGDHRREAKLGIASSAVTWLDSQVESLRESVLKAEHKLHDFQRDNGIEATSFDAYKELVSSRQADLANGLLGAERRQWELMAQIRTLDASASDPLGVLNTPLAEENGTLDKLSQQTEGLAQEVKALSARYGDSHPILTEARLRAESARNALRAELSQIASRVRNKKLEVDAVARRTRVALKDVRTAALKLNEQTITYDRLQAEIENSRALYGLVLRRSKETQISEVTDFYDVKIVEPAVMATSPSKPRVKVNILIGILLGMFAGVLAALVAQFFDVKLQNAEEAEQIVGRPHLGTLEEITPKEIKPQIAKLKGEERERYLALDERRRIELHPRFFPKGSVAESLRLFRTNVRFMAAGGDVDTFLVTSANPQEGKSTIVNYLGMSFTAIGDQRVVLVDSDLHRPMLHRAFGLPNTNGVSSLIAGGADLDSVIQQTDVENLDVITAGPMPPNSAELLGYPQFAAMINELKQRYDKVILDSPPILALSDALILSRLADRVILVVRPEVTDRSALKHVVRQMRNIDTPIAGFVFNRVRRIKRHSYYYYRYSTARYGYYYHREYGHDDGVAPSV